MPRGEGRAREPGAAGAAGRRREFPVSSFAWRVSRVAWELVDRNRVPGRSAQREGWSTVLVCRARPDPVGASVCDEVELREIFGGRLRTTITVDDFFSVPSFAPGVPPLAEVG